MARRPVKVRKLEEPAMSIQPKLDSSQAVSAFRRSIHWCMAVSLRDLPFIRRTLISLAVILSISGFTVALAQHQTNTRPVRVPAADSDEQGFAVDSELAISQMSLDMPVDSTGDVDRDFIAMMMPQHRGAIDVARAELKYGHNEGVRRIAQSIIAERENEMSAMRAAVGQLMPAQSSGTPIISERPPTTRIPEK
jgi:Domain of unknown function (DUF305)